jgi:predicted TIM-barrel fold metal-dependent hydrolase
MMLDGIGEGPFGLSVVDCDAHFTEPPDLWTSRASADWLDRVPVQRTVDGMTSWFLDGEGWASTGGNVIERGGSKRYGTHTVQPFDDVDEASWSVPARLKLMDALGIWAQVLYPNGVGFSSNHMFAVQDLDQRRVMLQIYNDFYADIQLESKGRLLPQAMLPIWDMALTVSEMTRLLDRDVRGFTLSDKPELLGLPELTDVYFDPMWDLFNESGAVANFHIGSGNRKEDMEAMRASFSSAAPVAATANPGVAAPAWRSFGRQRRLAITATQGYMSNVRIIANMTMSNLFDRFGKLKIVSAESGIGWVPFLMEALEYQLDEMVSETDELHLQKRRPTEYFRDHFSVMFWFERLGPASMIEAIGADNVLVETDVPHPTCLYPAPKEHFEKVLADASDSTRRKVLNGNAARLYKLTVPSSSGGQ